MTAAKARLPSLSALSAIGSTSLQGTAQAGPAMLPIDKLGTVQPTAAEKHFDDALAALAAERAAAPHPSQPCHPRRPSQPCHPPWEPASRARRPIALGRFEPRSLAQKRLPLLIRADAKYSWLLLLLDHASLRTSICTTHSLLSFR